MERAEELCTQCGNVTNARGAALILSIPDLITTATRPFLPPILSYQRNQGQKCSTTTTAPEAPGSSHRALTDLAPGRSPRRAITAVIATTTTTMITTTAAIDIIETAVPAHRRVVNGEDMTTITDTTGTDMMSDDEHAPKPPPQQHRRYSHSTRASSRSTT